MTITTQIKAVYLPVKYEANAGQMLLSSIDEGIQVLTSDPSTVTVLPLPRADLYLLKSEQLNRDDDSNLNRAASILLRESGLSNICVRGPALVVSRPDSAPNSTPSPESESTPSPEPESDTKIVQA